MKACAVLAVVLCAAVSGCTTTKISSVETGIMENDPEKIETTYDALAKKKLSGEILTKQDVEGMGFDLEAPNVEMIPGVIAFKKIFGDAVFRDEKGVDRSTANLKETEAYHGYWIPYQRIESTEDRIYLSEFEATQTGEVLYVFLIFKEEKLTYCELRRTRFSTYFSHYALLEGLVLLMQAPGKAALSLMEKLEEYKKPGLEYFVPIPIP